MQSEENKISSPSVRQLSSITLEEAICILKPDYMFFNTGNWHLVDESEALQEPCKKLYCNMKAFQFWFFNNKIDIQLIDDTFGIDLTQDINFDVKLGCYIRAVQSGFYVPSLSEFKFGYGQTQFVNELRDFSLDSLLSKFKNGHELFRTDVIFKAGIMQILDSSNIKPNNPEKVKFDVYNLVDLYIEQYKILYDNWRNNLNNILITKSSKFLIKDMNYVVFDGTSHYVCNLQDLADLQKDKTSFNVCFENVDIDVCQSEVDRLNDLV